MSEIELQSELENKVAEDYAIPNAEIQAEWEIDPHANPYELPLETLDPGHPDLFLHNTVLPYFERLRDEDPVHRIEESMFGSYWSITKYDDILEVEKQPSLFSSEQRYGGIQLGGRPYETPDPVFNLPMFIMMDPPKHTTQRMVVQPMFTPRALQEMESVIRQRACEILDDLPINEEFDWVSRVSIELTSQMLATFFDVPQEDRLKLIKWSDTIADAANPTVYSSIEEAFRELWRCHDYFNAIFEERKKWKEPGNDLVSVLAHSESMRDMPPNEFLGNILLLVVAGNDTTRNSISGGMLALNQFRDQYDKLRADHSLIPNMVSEMIRFHSPVAHMARTATEDTELRGKEIKEGQRLALWYVSGNRDEEVIKDADSFVIDRENARNHIAFGFGIHRCVGNRLADMQLRVLWEEIMQRFDDIEVVGEPTYLWSNFLRGVRALPVRINA